MRQGLLQLLRLIDWKEGSSDVLGKFGEAMFISVIRIDGFRPLWLTLVLLKTDESPSEYVGFGELLSRMEDRFAESLAFLIFFAWLLATFQM